MQFYLSRKITEMYGDLQIEHGAKNQFFCITSDSSRTVLLKTFIVRRNPLVCLLICLGQKHVMLD